MQPDPTSEASSERQHTPPADLRDASRGERLQRVLADAGVASRRACEQLIEAGRVSVNGQVVRTLPAWVDPARDHIRVDGNAVARPEPHLYIMLNKPARTLATPREGPDDSRPSALDLVRHPLSSRLFPAGRLDFEATGLLLLTNDGDLAHRLTHARFGVEKTYQMVVRGTITDDELARLQEALARMLRRPAAPRSAPARPQVPASGAGPRPAPSATTPPQFLAVVSREQGRTVLELTARDSRAAHVTDALAALGHPVKRLERVAIGPVRLRGVAVGHWRELERDELIDLRRAAAGKPTRRQPDPADERPKIAKRFRGIGRIVDAPGGHSKPGPGRRGAKSHATGSRPTGPRAATRASGSRPSAPVDRTSAPTPAAGPRPLDVRRGRGESVNTARRKPPTAPPPRSDSPGTKRPTRPGSRPQRRQEAPPAGGPRAARPGPRAPRNRGGPR